MQQPDLPNTSAANTNGGSDGDFVVLGKIIGFFGVRGWVKVYSDTDPRENIVSYPQWWLGDTPHRKPIQVRSGKRSGKNVVAQLAGIDTRELAAPLLGSEISVLRTMLPRLGNDEFYWTDLIGCVVEDINGHTFGPVDRLFETGANDVMVVNDHRPESESPGGELLIPWIRPSVITSIDLVTRRIVVDWDPDY